MRSLRFPWPLAVMGAFIPFDRPLRHSYDPYALYLQSPDASPAVRLLLPRRRNPGRFVDLHFLCCASWNCLSFRDFACFAVSLVCAISLCNGTTQTFGVLCDFVKCSTERSLISDKRLATRSTSTMSDSKAIRRQLKIKSGVVSRYVRGTICDRRLIQAPAYSKNPTLTASKLRRKNAN